MRSLRCASFPYLDLEALGIARSFVSKCMGVALLAASLNARAQPAPGPASGESVATDPSPEEGRTERTLLLLRTVGDEGIITRLRAELADAEWQVLELRLNEQQPQPSLATIAVQQRASAAIRVNVPSRALELWISSPNRTIQELLTASDVRDHEQVLALRAAETLRARGLPSGRRVATDPAPLRPPSAEPRAASAPLPATFDDAAARSARSHIAWKRLWTGIGPGVALSPGGLGPVVVALPSICLSLQRWSFSAFGVLPLAAVELAGSEGRARISTWMLGAGADLEWLPVDYLSFRSGIGLGGSLTTMRGTPGSGYQGVDDSVYAAASFLHSSASIHLGQSWRFGSSLLVGLTAPTVRVAFGPREAAHWGAPFVAISLTLDTAALSWR